MTLNKFFTLLCAVSILFAGCGKEDLDPDARTAEYRVSYGGSWASDTHPTDFPSDAGFSELIGFTHNATGKLFEIGTEATEGIQTMAETGGTGFLEQEINDKRGNGNVDDLILEGALEDGISNVSFTIEVSKDFPLISLVSMIKPSPDWFVGAVDVELFQNEAWRDNIELSAVVYDAGTDGGTSYESADAPTDGTISLLTTGPLWNGSAIQPPVGKFVFERLK